GAALMGIGFMVLVYNMIWSARYGERDKTGDPWDGRTLEWATPTPIPHYNFALIPHIKRMDEFWYIKKNKEKSVLRELPASKIKPIHMPNSSARPFIMSWIFFIVGFAAVFYMYWVAAVGLFGVLICMALRSFEKDDGHHVSVEEIKRTEKNRIKEA
ncbi:MAG TPA: cytochrome ubiquinol oxidase subunit I, partial [Bacillales bacterium]|nr:cytochrome ubiquinol oxidase subunit I [Bacillales bacterium]